jgi:excisionase family DNA binding protein
MNIVTVKELSKFLKISNSTIYKLASTGEIPAFRIGDSWRFDMDQIRGIIGHETSPSGREDIHT